MSEGGGFYHDPKLSNSDISTWRKKKKKKKKMNVELNNQFDFFKNPVTTSKCLSLHFIIMIFLLFWKSFIGFYVDCSTIWDLNIII